MGWSNYIYFKKPNIAIEIGKIDYIDMDETIYSNLGEYIEYRDTEKPKQEVLNYLWDKMFITDALCAAWSIIIEHFKDQEPKIIHEEQLSKLKNVKVLTR